MGEKEMQVNAYLGAPFDWMNESVSDFWNSKNRNSRISPYFKGFLENAFYQTLYPEIYRKTDCLFTSCISYSKRCVYFFTIFIY